jgi:hypothetical protein
MKTLSTIMMVCLVVSIFGCKPTKPPKPIPLAEVTTVEANEINSITAISGGLISNDGGTPVVQRGVCWSEKPNPTIRDSKTIDGKGIGNFMSILYDLKPNTTYYARAYAINDGGTAYGPAIMFTTAHK